MGEEIVSIKEKGTLHKVAFPLITEQIITIYYLAYISKLQLAEACAASL